MGWQRFCHHLPLGRQISAPLKNTQHFEEHIKQVRLEPGEVITSFDVDTIHISSGGPLHTNSASKVITGPHITTKGQHVHPTNN